MALQSLKLPRQVEDLVLWRDPKKSGGIVGATVLLYILLGPLSPITLPQLLAAVVLVTCPLFAAWHNAAPLLKRHGPPVPAILREGLTQQQVDELAEKAGAIINKALAVVGKLVSGQDVKLSGIVTASAFAAFRVFGIISPLTLAFILFIFAFTLPKVYEVKKPEIDNVVHIVVSRSKEMYNEVEKVVFKKAPGKAPGKTE